MAGTTADTRFFEERQKQPKRGLCIDCENNSNLKECNPYNMKMVSCLITRRAMKRMKSRTPEHRKNVSKR